MSKQKLFIMILSVIILSVIFQGTNAHVDEVAGTHDYGLVTGNSHAAIYHHCPEFGVFTASATCSVWASEDPHPNKFLTGYYDISAHADNILDQLDKSATTKADYFEGDLFDYVSDDEVQVVTFTGLVASASGGGGASLYLKMVIEGNLRFIPLQHVHHWTLPSWNIDDNVWEDAAPDCRICFGAGCNVCDNH